MSETKLVIDEETLESVVGLASRALQRMAGITESERQAGRVVAPGMEMAMIHLALRTAAAVLDRKAFPAGVPAEICALSAAAADRLVIEFELIADLSGGPATA